MSEAAPQPEDSGNNNQQNLSANAVAVFSGAGIGLLVGLLMGLSVSETVGLVVGALATSLALILGLNDQYVSIAKSLRIGAFGFLCAVGALTGTYLRTHQVLSPSPEDNLKRYLALGFEQREALSLIKLERFGISDSTTSTSTKDDGEGVTKSASLVQLVNTGVLYNTEIDAGDCARLTDKNEDDIADEFFLIEGFWKHLAIKTERDIGVDDAPRILMAMRDGVCAETSAKDKKFENCSALSSIDDKASAAQISTAFQRAGSSWAQLVDPIENNVDIQHRATALRILKESLCDDNKPT